MAKLKSFPVKARDHEDDHLMKALL